LDHFLVKATWPTACNSFERLPDDTSILARNCMKWGHNGGNVEVNRWGRYSGYGGSRIHNNVIIWEKKYYFSSQSYYCDDYTGPTYGALNVGDIWEMFVR
ncbi:hypothetical protein AC249_AIPGENE13777, partial [Exaiptasia diaphana]